MSFRRNSDKKSPSQFSGPTPAGFPPPPISDGHEFVAMAGRTTVVEDGTADHLSIVTPPAQGTVVPRGDRRMTINLNDVTRTDPIPFTYARTVGGTTQQVKATIIPKVGAQTGGWRKPAYYMPEVDAADDLVIQPGQNASCYLVKRGGKTWQQISTERGWGATDIGVVANRIRQNPQWGYGASDAKALDMRLAQVILSNYQLRYQQAPWLLFRRGDTFPDYGSYGGLEGSIDFPGESALHPIVIGAYGTGPKPFFEGNGPSFKAGCSYAVMTGLAYGRGVFLAGRQYMIADDLYCDYSFAKTPDAPAAVVLQGSDKKAHSHTALRRLNLQNVIQPMPGDPSGQWDFGKDRVSAFYTGVGEDTLIEKAYTFHSGWADDYTRSGFGGGQPPDDRGHGHYSQSNHAGLTVRYIVTIKPNFNAGQFRTGPMALALFGYKANSGYLMGATIKENNWSMADQVVQVGAGLKQYEGGPSVVAEGMTIQQPDFHAIRCGQFNSGQPEYFATNDPLEVANGSKLIPGKGQQYRADSFEPALVDSDTVFGSYAEGDDQNYAVANWINVASKNAAADAETIIAARTVGTWLDEQLGIQGATEGDFESYLNAHARPWEFADPLTAYWIDPLGWALPTRDTPQTCIFRPAVSSKTPGMRADIREDWTTQDMPGAVAGDSIDLDGHAVWWNQTPLHRIENLAFGKSGALHMMGGALRPTSVTLDNDGNNLTLTGGAKFDLDGYDGPGLLNTVVEQSRWINTGRVAGNVSVESLYRGEAILAESGGSFVLSNGQRLTAHGLGKIGFDGYDGGTASLIVQAGGVLDFRNDVFLPISGLGIGQKIIGYSGPGAQYASDWKLPKFGVTVTGRTSGATGVFRAFLDANLYGAGSEHLLYLTDVTGRFLDQEDIVAPELFMRQRLLEPGNVVGQVRDFVAAPYQPGCIKEVATGRGPQVGDLPAGFDVTGRTARPNINSRVKLEQGSFVEVSTVGLTPGEYPLIEVDSLIDEGAILPSGVSVSGNTMILTVS